MSKHHQERFARLIWRIVMSDAVNAIGGTVAAMLLIIAAINAMPIPQ